MAEQNKGIKISDLPQSVTFTGLWTLGYQVVDGMAVSVKVSLEEIQAAYEDVKSATADARQSVTDGEALRIDLLAAESMRAASEAARQQAENLRGEDEAVRKAAEEDRKSNESARQLQESQRSDAESARQSNETTREENEQARISAEEQREASEAARGEAEAVRESNEATRLSNETAREAAESTRVATEIEREANELTRKSNESARQLQEAERQTNTTTAIANAETATASANTAAQNAIKAKEDTEAATALATELNNHPWIIQGGVWYKWNTETDQYESTGISAKGEKGDTGTVGIRLDAEPTEDTLTYTVGDVTYNFELGMSAIYPDVESDNGYGLSFFMGTTEGKAIWGKGGGGAGSLNETVMISLVSNQDEAAAPDADLLGKSVHVIYGDQDKELVWQGEAIKTTVPMNMTYQVVFPTDDRYKCPEQREYTAIASMMREVNGLYYTEAVTVNVTCDDGTSTEGQQVTINGTVYDVDATGSVTAKIPFEVEYTVSVNAKSGYTSPSSVTKAANSKSTTIPMEYILIVYGVFIEATDGTLHQSTEWTGAKTANSIVVRQPTTAFRIALTQSSKTMKMHSNGTDPLESYMTGISDGAQAKLDMKSSENTANIMKLQSGTDYAAGYCNSFIFPDGKTKGLLPAFGWLQTAYDNKSAVDACFAACGATAMDTSNYHWASTFMGLDANKSRNCWRLRWSDGRADAYGYLAGNNRVRPFAEY